MPAYFSLVFEVANHPDVIHHFYNNLIHAGLTFCRGFDPDDTFENIIAHNQRVFSGAESGSEEDYKQILFTYSDFSEVRSFFYGREHSSTLIFYLIVPEEDLIECIITDQSVSPWRWHWQRSSDRMEQLQSLSIRMWETLDELLTVQTEWECSDCPPDFEALSSGAIPQAVPFCIIPDSCFHPSHHAAYRPIARNGILIEDKDAWDPAP